MSEERAALTSFADDAGGTDNLSVGSGVHGRDSSLTGGPARECALRNVADWGRGVGGGFCNKKKHVITSVSLVLVMMP